MPLKDVTVSPGLGELGRIRGGYFDKERNAPRSLPYFRLDDAPALVSLYGEQPTRLLWMAPYDDVDRVCSAYYERWMKRGLVCRGDGEHILKAIHPKTTEPLVQGGKALVAFEDGGREFLPGDAVPCPGLKRDLYAKCLECGPTVRLRMVIRDPHDESGRTIANNKLGFYLLSTGSLFNYRRLMEQLLWIQDQIDLANSVPGHGRNSLIMVPLVLERIQRELSYRDDSGEQKRREYDLLDCYIDPVWKQWQEARQQSVFDMPERPALPEVVEVLPDTEFDGMPMDEHDPPAKVVEGKVIPPVPATDIDWYNYAIKHWNFKSKEQFMAFMDRTYGITDLNDHVKEWPQIWATLHEDT